MIWWFAGAFATFVVVPIIIRLRRGDGVLMDEAYKRRKVIVDRMIKDTKPPESYMSKDKMILALSLRKAHIEK